MYETVLRQVRPSIQPTLGAHGLRRLCVQGNDSGAGTMGCSVLHHLPSASYPIGKVDRMPIPRLKATIHITVNFGYGGVAGMADLPSAVPRRSTRAAKQARHDADARSLPPFERSSGTIRPGWTLHTSPRSITSPCIQVLGRATPAAQILR